jgi:hypothetical protein
MFNHVWGTIKPTPLRKTRTGNNTKILQNIVCAIASVWQRMLDPNREKNICDKSKMLKWGYWDLQQTIEEQLEGEVKILIHSFIHSSINGSTALLLGPGLFCSFVIFLFFYTEGRTLWTSDQPVARPISTHRTTQTQNKYARTHTHT